MMHRLIVIAAALIGLMSSQAPIVTIYLATRPPPFITDRRWLEPLVVAPGGTITLHVEGHALPNASLDGCKATVRRTIVDSAGIENKYAQETRASRPSVSIQLMIPLGAAAGPATYRAHADWECNLVQHFHPYPIDPPELHFTIAPSSGQIQDLEKQGMWTSPGHPLSLAEETLR